MQIAEVGIYVYWFKNTGLDNCEQSYVGSTVNFNKRHKQHMNMLLKNKHHNNNFQHAFNKYGESNMNYEVVDRMVFPKEYSKELVRDYLESREFYYHQWLKSSYNKIPPGFHIQTALSTKEKSELYASRKKSVYLVDEHLNIIKRFSGLREAERAVGSNATAISKVAKLSRESTNGLKFRYEDTLNKPFIPKEKGLSKLIGVDKSHLKKALLCYNLDGSFLREFDGIVDAARELKIQESGVKRCAEGEASYVGNWIFRFKNSPFPVISAKIKNIKPIECYIDGVFYKEYANMNIAEKDLGVGRKNIHYYCNYSPEKLYKNKYQFKYKS